MQYFEKVFLRVQVVSLLLNLPTLSGFKPNSSSLQVTWFAHLLPQPQFEYFNVSKSIRSNLSLSFTSIIYHLIPKNVRRRCIEFLWIYFEYLIQCRFKEIQYIFFFFFIWSEWILFLCISNSIIGVCYDLVFFSSFARSFWKESLFWLFFANLGKSFFIHTLHVINFLFSPLSHPRYYIVFLCPHSS